VTGTYATDIQHHEPAVPAIESQDIDLAALCTTSGGEHIDTHAQSVSRASMAAHGRRCASLAFLVAGFLGMPESERNVIALAATVHDIGMMFVPVAWSQSAVPQASAQGAIIEAHVEAGCDLLAAYARLEGRDLSREIAIVAAHHERYDGHGYPRGLVGRHIPEGARVIAIVDAFLDTVAGAGLIGRSRRQVLELMSRESGKRFDPFYFSVFEKIIRQRVDILFSDYTKLFGANSRLGIAAQGIVAVASASLQGDRSFPI